MTPEELLARLDAVPRVTLAHLPTPLEPAPRLSAALGGPEIWLKRDDLTGLAFGGNKTRQLEYVFADILAKGADTVIGSAYTQSNWCRQMTAAAKKLGLDIHLVLLHGEKGPALQGNFLLYRLMGAEIEVVDLPSLEQVQPLLEAKAAKLREAGRKPYIVGPMQTENLVTGALGYVRAALEIDEQLERQGYEVEPRLLAERLEVSEQDVIDMETRLSRPDLYFDAPLRSDEADGMTVGDRMAAPGIDSETSVGTSELREVFLEKIEEFAGTLADRDLQILRRPSQLVVGTPGRLLDLVNRKALNLQNFSILVLDEFDRMLDMGFAPDVKRITAAMPGREQTLLFSATIDKTQQMLIDTLLDQPVEVKVSTGEATGDHIDQDIVRVTPGEDKFQVLRSMVDQEDFEKVLVFAETKHLVSKLCLKLQKSGIRAEQIHGNKSQSTRQKALDKFKKGAIQVLVATDVAARGLDITDVTHVINYQLPKTFDSYLHRIGRTGRAGKAGKAYTFVD